MRFLLVTALVVLAGCSSTPATEEGLQLGDGSTIDFDDVETSATTGAITGVVVDETIIPAAGVTVTISDGPSTTTDDGGVFVFQELDPGVYFLDLNGTGYGPVQTTADVKAGEVTKMRVVLPRDNSPQPYHDTRQFTWFDSAGVSLVDFLIDFTDDVLLGGQVPNACDECKFDFDTDGPAETIVIEAVWEDQVGHPAGPTSYYWNIEDRNELGNYEDDYFQTPGLVHLGDNRFGQTTEMSIAMSADETWITLDQSAEMFVTLFYLEGAPDGWTFVGA